MDEDHKNKLWMNMIKRINHKDVKSPRTPRKKMITRKNRSTSTNSIGAEFRSKRGCQSNQSSTARQVENKLRKPEVSIVVNRVY